MQEVSELVARVTKIVTDKGFYAVTFPVDEDLRNMGSITVSLVPGVWNETEAPEAGVALRLRNLRMTKKGWRAMKASFVRPVRQDSAQRMESLFI